MTVLPADFFKMRRQTGKISLWLAILIFGAAGAVTRLLVEIGSEHLVDGRNPISFCNVLFVGNLCALPLIILVYRREWNLTTLRQLSLKDWSILIAVAILSGALAPALFFQALSLTMVNNVILVGRIEPPLILALSVWLLRERVNLWQILGAIISFVGVIITIFFQPSGENMMNLAGFITLGTGEIMAAVAAVAAAVSTIITKIRLSQIPFGIYNVSRTVLGTVIFYFVALNIYGSDHFRDAFSPLLWRWMLVYSAVIVVAGQLLWLTGLKISTASEASLAGSFLPVAGIMFAYLILGEAPTLAQYIGGSVILGGILLSQIGIRRQSYTTTTSTRINSTQKEKKIQTEIGFKGV